MLGFAFKKDTGDTRETPAIDVGKGLIEDGAQLAIFDPKVSRSRSPWTWKAARRTSPATRAAKEALEGAHAVTIMTEWDEFKLYDWKEIYAVMQKPAFVFDGRNILDHEHLKEIGFIVYAAG